MADDPPFNLPFLQRIFLRLFNMKKTQHLLAMLEDAYENGLEDLEPLKEYIELGKKYNWQQIPSLLLDNPFVDIYKLEDEKDKCYVWVVNKNKDKREIAEYFHTIYREHTGEQTKALHLFLDGVDDIQKMDKERFKKIIKPWLMEE